MHTQYVNTKAELVAAIKLAVDEPMVIRWKRNDGKNGVTEYRFPIMQVKKGNVIRIEKIEERSKRILAVAKRAKALPASACA